MVSSAMASDFTPLQREIIAGLAAGTLTTIATHPLDLVKLRLQLLVNTTHSHGYKEVIKTIIRDSKADSNVFREAYRGLGVNLIGNSIAWGLYFGLYRFTKDMVYRYGVAQTKTPTQSSFQKDKAMGPSLYLASAALSGLGTAILTNPIWVIKTRIMSTSSQASERYKTTWDGIRKVYAHEGFSGFWRGLIPSLFGVAQGAIYFTIYDSLRHQYFARKGITEDEKMGNLENIAITSVSKMLSVTAVYPFQLLKSNLQSFAAVEKRDSYRFWNLVKSIHQKEGLQGLYKGLSANLLRAIPSTCITFCIYENLRHWL